MVTVRKSDAGFTLTELMVVVVILSLLAALSTPLFTRDNNARRGRDWAKMVAQLLQRARFQAMGDRANIHVLLHRTRVDMYREETTGTVPPFTLLSSTPGPTADGDKTVAIWDAIANNNSTLPAVQSAALAATPAAPASPAAANDIVFTSLGSTSNTTNWRVFLRNELLPSINPDASFVINIGGLTGFISSNDKVTLP
jgi:prepilin-type N-terminal cleavage/methylation domain-containing protein